MNKYQKGNGFIFLLFFLAIIGCIGLLVYINNKIKSNEDKLRDFEYSVFKDVNNAASIYKKISLPNFIVINYYKACFDSKPDSKLKYLELGYVDVDCTIKALQIAEVQGVAKETKQSIETWSNLKKTDKDINKFYEELAKK